MNVTELARRVKIPTTKLREIIPELGYDIGMRAIKVDDKIANEIIQKLSDKTTRDKLLKVEEEEAKEETQKKGVEMKEGVVQIPDEISVKDLSFQLHVKATELILVLMRNGVMAAQNEMIDFETASIVAEDFGYKTEMIHMDAGSDEEGDDAEGQEKLSQRASEGGVSARPPVIVVMGHVDHGKTKLLDAIRKTNIVDKEHGGITQHIGAYQVEKLDRSITFIDTPGHEAFTAMRSRGARVADIAILVVAADDGVQPQTIEALSHIQRAELPFIVAINKIDKENAQPDKVKQGLADAHVLVEGWGGNVPVAPISALKGEGIDELLDVVLLVADMQKDSIVADTSGAAVGTIIESHVDKGEGPVATVLVQHGVLKKGDMVQVGDVLGKIKGMRDYTGKDLVDAPPSTPAKILGLKSVPKVGDILYVPEDSKEAKKMRRKSRKAKGVPEVARTRLIQQESMEGATVKLIVKADVLGSLEAIFEALEPVQNQSGDTLQIIGKGLGAVSEADAVRAADRGALLLGFNVAALPAAEEFARNKKVPLHTYSVIYDLVNMVARQVEEVLPPEIERTEIGRLKLLKVFKKETKEAVIGCAVTHGKVTKDARFDIVRGEETVGTGTLEELQSGKQQVSEVVEGQECGMRLSGFVDFEDGDALVAFLAKEKKREVKV